MSESEGCCKVVAAAAVAIHWFNIRKDLWKSYTNKTYGMIKTRKNTVRLCESTESRVMILPDDTPLLEQWTCILGICFPWMRWWLMLQSLWASFGNNMNIALRSMHAFTGCDTVSSYSDHRKLSGLRILENSYRFQSAFSQLGDEALLSGELSSVLEDFTTIWSRLNMFQQYMFTILKEGHKLVKSRQEKTAYSGRHAVSFSILILPYRFVSVWLSKAFSDIKPMYYLYYWSSSHVEFMHQGYSPLISLRRYHLFQSYARVTLCSRRPRHHRAKLP